MNGRWRVFSAALLGCWALTSYSFGSEPPAPAKMSRRIDLLLAEKMEAAGIEPAQAAGDAEFLRRAYLDLTGSIPKVSETRKFLESNQPGKRAALIDSLLAHPLHGRHLATTWRKVLIPDSADAFRIGYAPGFENWLREQFADNKPYDATVRELLTASGQLNQAGPLLFFTAQGARPEDLAASTARAFLGLQLECAQCHGHPYDRYSQRDFWGLAAFFAQLQRSPNQQYVAMIADTDQGEATLPDSDKIVPPRFPDGTSPEAVAGKSRRALLADWITSPNNPYFAKATVNRAWFLLFGRGLVEPVDDLRDDNPGSHPQLLGELAEYFTATGFDLRNLLRVLANTEAYQRSSRGEHRPPELFAQMAVKRLTAEQIYDCLQSASLSRPPVNAYRGYFQFDQNRQLFVAKFQSPGAAATEFDAGIPQALSLMNGSVSNSATGVASSQLLLALEAPFFSDDQRLETIFLSTLSRVPSEQESRAFAEHIKASEDKKQALADVLWALINSAEFLLNH